MSQKKKHYEFNKQTPAAPPAVRKVETDEILSGNDKMMYLLGLHWKKIAIGIGALVVIVVALVVIKFVREQNDLELRQAIAAAKTVEDLQPLVDEYQNHPAVIPALFRLGDLYAKVNDYEKAAETFKKIYDAQENVNRFDRLRAGIAAAYQLAAAGKDTEAIALFTAVAQDQTVQEYPMLLQEAAYNAANLHVKAGKAQDALVMLDKVIISDANTSFWQEQCKKLKDQLAAK